MPPCPHLVRAGLKHRQVQGDRLPPVRLAKASARSLSSSTRVVTGGRAAALSSAWRQDSNESRPGGCGGLGLGTSESCLCFSPGRHTYMWNCPDQKALFLEIACQIRPEFYLSPVRVYSPHSERRTRNAARASPRCHLKPHFPPPLRGAASTGPRVPAASLDCRGPAQGKERPAHLGTSPGHLEKHTCSENLT